MAKKYKCPYCEERLIRKELIDHIDKEHEELIPESFISAQIVYDLVNGTKGYGRCRVCGKPTKWNKSSGRYDVLCENPKCKEHMREEYKKNMLKIYGTYNILESDEQQKKMLANRSISGKYKFSDGGILTYTGSYERKFLEFADKVMQIPSKDIMAPGPTLEYEMDGKKHFYITDFLYIPYNAIIEIKDGGLNPNTKDSDGMRSSRLRTMRKEELITNNGTYNYLRLTDNNFVQLLEFFMDIKKALLEGNDDKVIKINESYIQESKSIIDSNYKPKGKKNLSSFKKIHITESVINKYKKEYPFLSHVRCKDTKEYICDGYIWFDNDELVAMVGSCEYRDDKTRWVVSLEITKKYRGYGLSKQILDYAVKTMNCKYLSVNKNNKIAKKVYDDYGFKVYQEDNTMYYMTIDKNIKELYINDKGEKVPEVCPKCGSKVGVYLRGEPVYLCSNCNKFFGVVQFKSKKEFTCLQESKNIFSRGDFIRHDIPLTEIAEKHINEAFKSVIHTIRWCRMDCWSFVEIYEYNKPRMINNISFAAGKICNENAIDEIIKTINDNNHFSYGKYSASVNDNCELIITIDDLYYYTDSVKETAANLYSIKESSNNDLTKFNAYHLEPLVKAKNKKKPGYWDKELYSKTIETAIVNDIQYNYECKRYNRVSAYVYTAGRDLRPVYLGSIIIFDKNNPSDWEWEEQNILSEKDYDYLIKYPMVEAVDISNFYIDD